MNCANHSDQPVSAYCQNCGKPLCTQCVRSVAGVVYCEPCLAARLQAGGSAGNAAAGGAGWSRVPETPPSASSAAGARLTPVSGPAPSPVLAGFLGAIPGVGAMYNGQFVKAFAHVIIFVVLISISDHFNAAGVLVGAWIFYQIFDAVQTAIARREGRPLPDPLGLNDLGQRLGVPAAAPYSAPAAAYGVPVQPITNDPAAPGFGAVPPAAAPNPPFTAGEYNPGAGFNPGPPIPPAPPIPPGAFYGGRPEPVGAIVLIGVGMLFLLSTLGVFRWDWVGRGWPVLIILIGAGLLFSRLRSTRRAGGGL